MAAPGLQEPAKKALATLDREWDGLAAHREYPMVSLDNNAAERALRRPVVTRKNAYGSRWRPAASVDRHRTRRSGRRRNPDGDRLPEFGDGGKAEAGSSAREAAQTTAATARPPARKEPTLANWVKNDKDNEAVAAGVAPLSPAERYADGGTGGGRPPLQHGEPLRKKARPYFASQNL